MSASPESADTAGCRLLIVWHSGTGGARQMAAAAAAGARREARHADGTTDPDAARSVRLQHASRTRPADFLAAQGFLFVTPEYLGTMAGRMKDCFDRCYYPLLDALAGRPYASLICAGSDGSGAARQIARIATGWRLQAVAEPLIVCTHAQTPAQIAALKRITAADLQRCEELGAALAAGLALGVF